MQSPITATARTECSRILRRSLRWMLPGALLLIAPSPAQVPGTGGVTPTGPPEIEVASTTIEFGEAPIAETRRRVVTIRNQGGALLFIAPVRLRRGAASPFGTCGIDRIGFVVPPGEVRRLLFCFTPTAGGPVEDILEIRSNDADEPMTLVTLRGSAPGPTATITAPVLLLTSASNPTGAGGGRFRVGESVTVRYSVEADDTVSLRLESGGNTVSLLSGQAVRAGENQNLVARAPDTPGSWHLVLARASAAPGRRLGFAVARGPRLEVTAPPFPEGPAGQARRQTILVRNGGVGALEIAPPALQIGACSAFAFCGATTPLILGPGGTAPIEICVTPRTAGEFRDALLLISNDPDQPEMSVPLVARSTGATPAAVVGTAAIGLTVDPPTTADDLSLRVSGVDWPNVCFPRARTSVRRTGNRTLIDTSTGDPTCPPLDCEPGRFPWSIASEPIGTLPAGRHEVIVTFYGQVIGRRHFFVFPPGGRPATPPAASGSLPEIEVTAETLDLGDVAVGASGQASVTVRNSGPGPLTVGAARIEPAGLVPGGSRDAFRFCAGPPAGFTLPPGESREIPLCFTPTEPCPHEATLVLLSSDPDEPSVAIPLRGQSTAGAPVLGQPFRGSLRATGETNTFCVALGAGDRLLARVSRASGDFQPAFRIDDPTGAERLFVSGSLPFELPNPARDGLYRVAIGARADGSPSAPGDYGLYLQRLNRPENAAPLAPERQSVGEIAGPAEMDAYTFTGAAGETIRLTLLRTTGSFRPALRIYSPDGILVGQSWQPRGAELQLLELLPATGAYTVLVDDGAEDGTGGTLTGTYTLTLSR